MGRFVWSGLGIVFFMGSTSCTPSRAPEGDSRTEAARAPSGGRCASTDPFAITGENTKTGECVPLHPFRVVRPLEGNASIGYLASQDKYKAFAAKYGFDQNVTSFATRPIIANVGHDGQYWLAQLDLGKVENVYFQVEEFPNEIPPEVANNEPGKSILREATANLEAVNAQSTNPEFKREIQVTINDLKTRRKYNGAHGQLRIDFSEPIMIVNQTTPSKKSTLRSVVFSVQAGGLDFTPIKIVDGSYPLVLGVYSLAEKFNDAIVVKKNTIRQYAMNLRGDDLTQFVNLYLKNAETLFRQRDYNVFSASCGNTVFETIEIAFYKRKYGAAKLEQILAVPEVKYGRNYPKYAQFALKAYGFLADPNNMRGTPWTRLDR